MFVLFVVQGSWPNDEPEPREPEHEPSRENREE
jgi:hypothetical protein